MKNLFESRTDFHPIDLPGADVSYLEKLDLGVSSSEVLGSLIEQTAWRQENVKMWGKTFLQPRLVAWYGDPGKAYRYSGIALEPMCWTTLISGIKTKVEDKVKTRFNSVLLNYYRDQNDSMGMHSDDERELGERPTIASISLGAERSLLFKSKADPKLKTVKLRLASGSLLLMTGDTQRNYKHGIAKESQTLGARVNLTFRTIFA